MQLEWTKYTLTYIQPGKPATATGQKQAALYELKGKHILDIPPVYGVY